MNTEKFYTDLQTKLTQLYPTTATSGLTPNLQILISPFEISLPKKVFITAENAIRAFYKLSRTDFYSKQIANKFPDIFAAAAKNSSVLMAYDFHTNANGECFLIEINTNASGFLLADLLLSDKQPSDSTEKLFHSFEQEAQQNSRPIKNIAIVDENIPQQKMYLEFFMYKDFFRRHGWHSEFSEANELRLQDNKLSSPLLDKIDFVYNRTTDFTFASPALKTLHTTYINNWCTISPHPKEYLLLADKNRLIDLTQTDLLKNSQLSTEDQQAIVNVLIPTKEPKDFVSIEELWSMRKELFFKPPQAYGGKAAFKGASLSRKAFDRIIQEGTLIQKYVPAQNIVFDTDPKHSEWKFDLRFYVYQDQIQQVVARLYQGQVTNFSSPLGGFSKTHFISST